LLREEVGEIVRSTICNEVGRIVINMVMIRSSRISILKKVIQSSMFAHLAIFIRAQIMISRNVKGKECVLKSHDIVMFILEMKRR